MSNVKLAFITGITGQDGSYLSELLLDKGYKVYGIVRRTSLLYSHSRIDHIREKLNINYGDVSDACALHQYFNLIVQSNHGFEVFEIYNLAAQSHVQISFEIPEYTTNIDALGPLHILEFIRSQTNDIKNKIKFYQAGTSEMYGKVLETPQKETTPFNPVSPYACAKLYGHFITKNYRDAYDMFACNGILFNHESPRRGENFVTMKIINGINDYLKTGNAIKLGNIDSKRDWGHAKDYVYGMWLMLQQENPDDYVLATGETQTVREFIEKSLKFKGIQIRWEGEGLSEKGINVANEEIIIKIDKKYFRPCEVELLLGDPTKAINALGWKHKYNLDMLIDDMFNGK
ncbi:MAG: GDP-mannose 4,6-dehydratase [Candidatus Paceibacterota bacterium]